MKYKFFIMQFIILLIINKLIKKTVKNSKFGEEIKL